MVMRTAAIGYLDHASSLDAGPGPLTASVRPGTGLSEKMPCAIRLKVSGGGGVSSAPAEPSQDWRKLAPHADHLFAHAQRNLDSGEVHSITRLCYADAFHLLYRIEF